MYKYQVHPTLVYTWWHYKMPNLTLYWVIIPRRLVFIQVFDWCGDIIGVSFVTDFLLLYSRSIKYIAYCPLGDKVKERRSTCIVLMLGQRRRRWAGIKTTQVVRLVFAGLPLHSLTLNSLRTHYYPNKSLISGTKCVFKQQDLQMFALKLNKWE